MLRALGWLLVVIVIGGGWWAYNHTGGRAVSNSGEVFPRDTSSDGDSAAPSTATPAPTTPAPAPATSTPAAAVSSPIPTNVATSPATSPAAAIPALQPPVAGLPVSDTLPRESPAGMAFGGSGKYQWYRQGDITWRIDTASGNTCIDFATMEEWARPLVYSHGCARS